MRNEADDQRENSDIKRSEEEEMINEGEKVSQGVF